jgi:ankyrin repeat protein
MLARLDSLDLARALLDLGADPKLRDGSGNSALAYCNTIESFKLIQGYGLDPNERMPDGGTLLHNLVCMTGLRAQFPEEVAFFKFLLSLGLDINAIDAKGKTMLHRFAERTDEPKDVALLLASGADKAIKDKSGKRAYDLVPKSLKDVRDVLK